MSRRKSSRLPQSPTFAAQLKTQSAPSTPRRRAPASSRSPWTFSTPQESSHRVSLDPRTRALTWNPRFKASSTAWLPTRPVAPVMNSVLGSFMIAPGGPIGPAALIREVAPRVKLDADDAEAYPLEHPRVKTGGRSIPQAGKYDSLMDARMSGGSSLGRAPPSSLVGLARGSTHPTFLKLPRFRNRSNLSKPELPRDTRFIEPGFDDLKEKVAKRLVPS